MTGIYGKNEFDIGFFFLEKVGFNATPKTLAMNIASLAITNIVNG